MRTITIRPHYDEDIASLVAIFREAVRITACTAVSIGTCLLDETAHTTGGQRFMSSVGIQGQPKFRVFLRP